MPNQIQPYTFQGKSIVVIQDTDGEPLFEVNSLCELLGYANPRDVVAKRVNPEDVAQHYTLTAGGKQKKNFVKERGMWKLVMKSEAPNAEPVQDWIAGEVLPSIRKTGGYSQKIPANAPRQDGMPELRKAKALSIAEETAARLCARFPKLSDNSRQVIFAKIFNPIAGSEVLSLPSLEERLLLAGEVGKLLGVSAQKIGRVANEHLLKTPENGEFRLSKSEHSDKQVEVFCYSPTGIEKLRAILEGEPAHA